jgi:hypothetical protein
VPVSLCRWIPFWGLIAVASLSLAADPASKAELLRLLNTAQEEAPRLAALRKLEASGAVDAPLLMRCLTDTSPRVRAEVLRIGKPWLTTDPELELRFLALVHDRSPIVRQELLKTLPAMTSERARATWIPLLKKEIDSPGTPHLAVQALGHRILPTLQTLALAPEWNTASAGKITFFEFAANTLCDPPTPDVAVALLSLCAEPTRPKWMRLAILRGANGRIQPSRPGSDLKTLRFPEAPSPLRNLLHSKDPEILSLLTAPGGRFLWPAGP